MSVSNIIEVTFGASHSVALDLDTAFMYNDGIYLKPTDLDLGESYQVHFANDKTASTSLEVVGTAENGALIPWDVWNNDKSIYAYYYLHPTDDSSVTAYMVQIFKKQRAGLPDGTEPSESEQSTIDTLVTALNTAVADAEQAKQDAEDARDESATNVTHYPIITDGYWYVWDAETSAYVNTNVKAVGEDGDDGVGISSIAKTGTSGLVDTYTITFTDGTTTTYTVTNGSNGIDGVGISSIEKTSTSGLVDTYTITYTDGTTSTYTVTNGEDGDVGATPNLSIGTVTTLEPTESATATITGTAENPVLNLGIPKGADGDDYVLTDTDKAEIADIVETDIEPTLLSAFPTDTASGAVASFTDGANLPLKSLMVGIDYNADGWTGMSGQAVGKNLFDQSLMVDQSAWNTFGVKLAPNTTYTMSTTMPTGLGLLCYFNNTGGSGGSSSSQVTPSHSVTVTSTSDGYVYVSQRRSSGSDSFANYNFQIEVGSSATTYEPYTLNKDISIQFGTTVYGGSLDVLSGVLTSTLASDGTELEEPVTYQLTAQEVSSLYGGNTIYADTGDTTAQYYADPTLYIQRLTVPDSDDMVADANITSGQYFMVGNSLYIATANIANGSDIVVGTNCTRKSLAEALNEINA